MSPLYKTTMTTLQRNLTRIEEMHVATADIQDSTRATRIASINCVIAYGAWEEDRGADTLKEWWNAAEDYYEKAKVAVEHAKALSPGDTYILYTLQDVRGDAFDEMKAVIDQLQLSHATLGGAQEEEQEDCEACEADPT